MSATPSASAAATPTLRLRQPDDWHLHLRDGAMLKAVLPFTARTFARAIVMPNLSPPVVTAADARAYRARILAALPEDARAFQPLMTAYLTEGTDPDDLAQGFADGTFTAVKLYPAHATTNAAHGVSDLDRVAAVFARMERIGMPLLIHGEVTDPAVDIFDREAVFIERHLAPLIARFPGLKVVLEHITTADAVDFVRANAGRRPIAATITAHHLLINRNAIFDRGLRPHAYCLPVAKRERHRQAVLAAATSGEPVFFLGTDSAPHPRSAKESGCGCAGIFTAPHALGLYAEAFERVGALDRLPAFASEFGPRFYGVALNEREVMLERAPEAVPETIACPGGDGPVVPFRAGGQVAWRIKSEA